jgi:hypothetical protein
VRWAAAPAILNSKEALVNGKIIGAALVGAFRDFAAWFRAGKIKNQTYLVEGVNP